jgi:branched-chain amino acid transport system substrate-binding protein
MASAGAGAILKIGLGGTTMTAARNIKSLGLDTLMLTSTEDLAVFRPVSEVLGDKFFFVAAPAQVYDALPEGPQKKAIAEFLPLWRAKHGERDPHWGGRAWDAVMMAAAAVQKAKTFEGPKVRDALETISGYQGTGGVYSFSADHHYGITQNPYVLATFAGGKPKVVK